MMAMSKEVQVDITSCPICFETFNIPKYLPCLHSFCEGCLQTYITSAFRVNSVCNGINCPVCRAFVQKPESAAADKWAKEFPSNHLLISIIDIENAKAETRRCNACARENETASAKSWCMNCCEALCESCERTHRKLKHTSQHKVFDIDKMPESSSTLQTAETYCNEHSDKKLEAYCYDHSAVCCMSCIMLLHRKCDRVESVEKAANMKKKSDDITKLEQSLADMKKQLENLVKLQMTNMTQCQTDISNIRKYIENLFQDTISHLESLRDKSLEEVAAAEKESIPDYETTIEEMKCKISAIEYDIKILHTNLEHGAPAQFLQAMTQLTEQRDMLEKFLNENEESLQTIKITYDANDKISYIVKGAVSLCSVAVKRQNIRQNVLSSITNMDLVSVTPRLVKDFKNNSATTGVACIECDLFLVSRNGGRSLELWNDSCTQLSSLSLTGLPWNVKMMNHSEGAVVVYNKALMFFEIQNDSIRKVKDISVPVLRDFEFHKGRYYIGSNKKIIVQDSSNQHVHDIAIDGEVAYMAARDKNSLCYTKYDGLSLHCITLDGKSVFKVLHPSGLKCIYFLINSFYNVSMPNSVEIL